MDFKDKNLDKVQSIKVNSFPTLEIHLTPKSYVAQAISNIVVESMLRLDPDEKIDEEEFKVFNYSITLPKTIIKLPTKSYVDRNSNHPGIIRNKTHGDFNDENLDNVRLV